MCRKPRDGYPEWVPWQIAKLVLRRCTKAKLGPTHQIRLPRLIRRVYSGSNAE
jgi:hypothetical protein